MADKDTVEFSDPSEAQIYLLQQLVEQNRAILEATKRASASAANAADRAAGIERDVESFTARLRFCLLFMEFAIWCYLIREIIHLLGGNL